MTDWTYLTEIPHEECRRLLSATALGRLGVVIDGRPEIFPVNHVYDETTGSIMFPSNEHTKWHASLDWPWVAFEIDGMEPHDTRGWSVAVVGRAEEVSDPEVIERAVRHRSVGWFLGPGTRWLRIVPTKMTGWRVNQPEEAS